MTETEHIPNEKGRPFCGVRARDIRFASEVTPQICQKCLVSYRNYAQDAVEDDIKSTGWEWASYLLSLPAVERTGTLAVLLKTLEIETRRCLEGER